MSSLPDMDLDLEKLFLPAWAQEKPSAHRYEKFTGEPAARDDRQRGGRRGGRERRLPAGELTYPRKPARRQEAGAPGVAGGKFGDRQKGFGRREGWRPALREEPREPPAPLPEIAVTFLPDAKGVESLARQIKMTGRAYPLFQIAQLVLQKPERYAVRLAVKKKRAADIRLAGEKGKVCQQDVGSTIAQPLFVCALDDTPWLSEDEAVAHVLKNHFATFYRAERTATEPPRGTYTFVAQCGLSGVILGPPNHHDYQNRLRKLHAERFARMPFDAFKARVKIVKDEAVVKKWVEEQSFKTEYTVLNVPEPLKLPDPEAVEKHFRATHKEAIIKPVEAHTVGGVPSRNLRSRELQRLVRAEWEQQRHFPLQLATELSRQFAAHGLQFFKVNKTVTHVSVARPQFLDLETTPVSENIKRIIAHIHAHPKGSRRQLLETLAPTPAPVVIEIKPETEAPPGSESRPPTAGAEEPPKGGTPNPPAATAEPTPEQNVIIGDLHWLVHQGHVLEFADGRLETAKKPAPKPPKPEKKPAAEIGVAAAAESAAQAADAESATTEEPAPAEAAVPPPDEPTEEAVESPS